MITDLPLNPLAIVDASESSLPGPQAKMLLVARGDGTWARPLGGRPSTHILKRDGERHPGLVAAECDALALARHVGLTTVNAHIERHGDYDCILVERSDRIIDDAGNVTGRVHQEDACQALGLPPTQKYELHHGGGGPTFQQVASLLDCLAAAATACAERMLDALDSDVIDPAGCLAEHVRTAISTVLSRTTG
jgi:serine/threonine-protein kinase HipA